MKRLSLVTTLSDKVREDELVVLKTLELENAKTGELVRILDVLNAGPSTLLVADGTDPMGLRSGRNIPRLKMVPAALLNTLDLLKHRKIIMTLDAVRKVEELWGGVKNLPKKRSVTALAEG